MEMVAVTLDNPALSAIGVIVSEVIVPVEVVDVPLTKVNGNVGLAGDRLVSVTVESMLVCIMQASKILMVCMQTFSHKPFIGLPLMFPGHLSDVELLLQKDIFLPPVIFAAIYAVRQILLQALVSSEKNIHFYSGIYKVKSVQNLRNPLNCGFFTRAVFCKLFKSAYC